ncbi:MAG: YbgC/FadM family acyl-CoA thioesterase [Burkholderiaceae bacterium]
MNDHKRQDFRLLHPLRVRWGEVDLQRIVFNPHYLSYIDIAFTEYWRALAVPYESIPAMLGGDLFVKKSTLEYHGSAQLDDQLTIGLRCARIGKSSMLFHGGIFRGEIHLVSSELVYVFADPVRRAPLPVPDALREIVHSFEAGQSQVDVLLGTWEELGAQAGALRKSVFGDELQIAAALDFDASDPAAQHVLVRSRLGQALATGRISFESPGVARLARLVVLRAMRSAGFGRIALQTLLDAAAARGASRVLLLSQQSAEGFYRSLGFAPIAEPVMEAGVPHVEMARALQPDQTSSSSA